MSEEKQSAAASAADKVRAILEAAEQSGAALRAEAAEEIDAQLEKAEAVAARLSERAHKIEESLQKLADSMRDEVSALKADLEELRAVGEGVSEARTTAAEPVAPEPEAEPAPEPESERPPQPPTDPRPEPRPVPPEEPPPNPPEPAAGQPTGDGHEGARVIALNMALSGSPRDETARYLSENFELDDPEALLDEVYARVSG